MSMNIPFIKMHGNGNDFVIVDKRNNKFTIPTNKLVLLSNRNKGIGFDQFIQLEKDSNADVFMRIFNSDGTEAEMCVNAARCVASLILASLPKKNIVIQTISGEIKATSEKNGEVSTILKIPNQSWKNIPLSKKVDLKNLQLSFKEEGLVGGMAINMGNPHVVFFCKNIDNIDLKTIGPKIENHSLFPDRTNLEIVQLISKTKLKVKVWERGSGITLSCGSGALASFYSAYKLGLCDKKIVSFLPGGEVLIALIDKNKLKMTGKVEVSYFGEFIL